jgi:pimeloyl-ACP methyl ester carboxylesterase
VDAELAPYYGQALRWGECPGGNECAVIEAPLDWEDPGGERIEVAFARIPAGDPEARIGSLLVNPGGPGASGIEYLESLAGSLSPEVLERYDLVGFDPRGVGLTEPVACYDSERMNQFLGYWRDPMDTAGIVEARKVYQDFGLACLANTGEVLGHVDSVSTARDMDLIRSALGDAKLNYVGFSYGTLLGALYAEAYPDRVGRMVLDGAVDPSKDSATESLEQIAGFEDALKTYVGECHEEVDCPLRGTAEEGLAQLHDFIAERQDEPLATDFGRGLGVQEALMGILVCMYEDTLWPVLTMGLDAAMTRGDGTMLMRLADSYFSRDSDTGEFLSNMFEAFFAIGCLDAPTDAGRAAMDAMAQRLTAAAPTLGEFSAYGELGCAEWPFAATGTPHRLDVGGGAADLAPVLVVGTTGDPATPYESAVALAEQLGSAVLITFEGEGHTAVGRSNGCVTGAVDGYLLEGEVPADDVRC